jgi:hypothetical protein
MLRSRLQETQKGDFSILLFNQQLCKSKTIAFKGIKINRVVNAVYPGNVRVLPKPPVGIFIHL